MKQDGKFLFKKMDFLSCGAEGQVYSIKNKQSGEILAAKYLNQNLGESEQQLLEKIKSSKFNHIIKIIDLTKKNGQDIIIMEYGEQSLKKLMESENYQQQSKEYKNELFLQILLGVEEFHSLNYIHRDLKPDNFICCSGNQSIQIKLIDFGLAKESKYSKHTQGVGTDYFMAPEVKNGIQYDQSADLWSLGVIWYQMLCGYLDIFKLTELTQIQLNNNINKNQNIDSIQKQIISKILLIQPQKRMKLNELLQEITVLCSKENKLQQQKEQIQIVQKCVPDQKESNMNTLKVGDEKQVNQKEQIINFETIYQEGKNLCNKGQYEQALVEFNKSISLINDNSDVYTWKGFALRKLNKFKEAIDCYDQAIAINSKNESAWNNKGFALRNLNKFNEAIDCYDQAIAINSKYESAWNNKGAALHSLNKFKTNKMVVLEIDFLNKRVLHQIFQYNRLNNSYDNKENQIFIQILQYVITMQDVQYCCLVQNKHLICKIFNISFKFIRSNDDKEIISQTELFAFSLPNLQMKLYQERIKQQTIRFQHGNVYL
ncbi:unnamed protein product [Paramecium sonneborni]|uniref:Protein kinase domain-containing protein n=1 Tax=Paramecium sonneborni TaxID=65129 RepID=A0A8S1RJL3_9CILI|nr:unnamed protein product [Paramecium sonneborni]